MQKKRTTVIPTESEEQQLLFEWVKWNIHRYPELALLYATPNGGKRDKSTAVRLKREGVLAGVSDIHLPIPKGKYHSLWIELKVGRNKPTERQQWFMDEMNRYGHYACVAYGWEEAKAVILWYLKLKGTSDGR